MTADPQPIPVSVGTLDTRLSGTLTRVHRTRWATTSAIVVVLCMAVGVFGWMVLIQRDELTASCMFYREIATLAVPAPKAVPPATRDGVALVVTARNAYLGEKCGVLPSPSANLTHWAHKFNFRLPG